MSELNPENIKITHYYGISTLYFDGVVDFAIARVIPWVYIKISIIRWLSATDQYFFNKKKLITKQRTDLLKFLIDRALDGRTEHDPITLMTELHSMRWFLHPQGADTRRQLTFYLDALADTGELRRQPNGGYVLTGYALQAVETNEEQDRKHTENVKMQRRTILLSLVVAALTVIQAGIVQLPVLLNLSGKK